MAEESTISFAMIWVPHYEDQNSYTPLTRSFKSLWSRMRFVVKGIITGGGLPCFLGASCSGNVFFA
jgi:hypothetical protein